ncbi:hypothetical protein JCM8202_004282 [Rhodotorula sphaerocarpa]
MSSYPQTQGQGFYPKFLKGILYANLFFLLLIAVICSLALKGLPPSRWHKAWVIASAVFADFMFVLTAASVFMTMGVCFATFLHACLLANAVFWSLATTGVAQTCSFKLVAWTCTGPTPYVFYSCLIVCGILQFLYLHLILPVRLRPPRAPAASDLALPRLRHAYGSMVPMDVEARSATSTEAGLSQKLADDRLAGRGYA